MIGAAKAIIHNLNGRIRYMRSQLSLPTVRNTQRIILQSKIVAYKEIKKEMELLVKAEEVTRKEVLDWLTKEES